MPMITHSNKVIGRNLCRFPYDFILIAFKRHGCDLFEWIHICANVWKNTLPVQNKLYVTCTQLKTCKNNVVIFVNNILHKKKHMKHISRHVVLIIHGPFESEISYAVGLLIQLCCYRLIGWLYLVAKYQHNSTACLGKTCKSVKLKSPSMYYVEKNFANMSRTAIFVFLHTHTHTHTQTHTIIYI